ncbi:MAG: glutathione S-transferase family protein [Rudaea sp.]|nr:glutathione S-transferase family protein [Rudaea sp.]
MLTVHHLGISQSDRIVWLCEELGVPYELVHYDRDPKTRMAPPEYRALHPFGTAPVITDGDLSLGESTAIVDYIVATYGQGRLTKRAGDSAFPEFLYWHHFANGSMMPAIGTELVVARTAHDPASAAWATTRSVRAWAMVEQRLGEAKWFAGEDFTTADIMMVFPLTTMRAFAPKDLAPFPNIRAYLARLGTRPAYCAAMAKADPGVQLRLD